MNTSLGCTFSQLHYYQILLKQSTFDLASILWFCAGGAAVSRSCVYPGMRSWQTLPRRYVLRSPQDHL